MNIFGLSGAVWATIILVVATAVTLTVIVTRRDIAYTAAIVWALVDIFVKQSDTSLVAITAALMAATIIGAALVARVMGTTGKGAVKRMVSTDHAGRAFRNT